jgi:hypothetical protein
MRIRRDLKIESRLRREWNRSRSGLILRTRRDQNSINKKNNDRNANSKGNSAKSPEGSEVDP